MNNVYAVIMAGGSGTRFWPASRRARPKQLLALDGSDRPLLASTAERIAPVVPPERVFVVTSERLTDAVRETLPDVPAENILAEPISRNTAPCVGWAAARIAKDDPEGVLAVLPADHCIADPKALREAMDIAFRAAAEGDLVTIGIRPTRPETGYGYLEVGEELGPDLHRARRFVEKPNRQRAEQFLASGNYLWNAGMFFFRADVIVEAIRTHLPGVGEAVDAFLACEDPKSEAEAARERYPDLPSISIDHGVMEKAESVSVVQCTCGWSDLGSWTTAWELADKVGAANSLPADAIAIDTSGCFSRAPEGKLVALVGVHDLVVVDTEDALLVVPRDRAQDVREVVEALKKRGDPRI